MVVAADKTAVEDDMPAEVADDGAVEVAADILRNGLEARKLEVGDNIPANTLGNKHAEN